MESPQKFSLNGNLSLTLDFWRALAALAVLLHHGTKSLYSDHALPQFVYGHEAVIIFFVLSGFVISFVHENGENRPSIFFLKRFARLYSVLIPAVLLTLILDQVGRYLYPVQYALNFEMSGALERISKTVLFLGENWSDDLRLGTNRPIWSLHFEFWYYVLFGAFVFARSLTARWLLVGVIALFVGPRILALLPCWLLGVAAFQFSKGPGKTFGGWVPVILSLALFLICCVLSPLEGLDLDRFVGIEMQNASAFLDDILLAGFFAFHLFCAARFFRHNSSLDLSRFAFWVTPLAGTSFTLYLCHAPVLRFFAAVFGLPTSNPLALVGFLGLVFALCFGLGLYIEKQKKPLFHFLKRSFHV